MDFPRVMPALITPFTAAGEIDVDAHVHNVGVMAGHTIEGILLAGSTGEGYYLEPGERATLIEAARREAGDSVKILCGIMAESVRQAVAQASEATAAGADAVVVLTPTTAVRDNDAAVGEFFLSVADTSQVPVLLYSVPAYTAYELPVGIVERIAGHTNIVGMKDSGGHPARMERLAALTGPGWVLFAGSSASLRLSLAAGAYGAITASTNYVPRLVQELVAAAHQDVATAGPAQAALTRLTDEVERHRVPGVKAAAVAAGLAPGLPRAPLRDLPDSTGQSLRAMVEAATRSG